MAEKQDIAMNAFKVLTDVTYVYGEASDSSQGKIGKGDLLSGVLKGMDLTLAGTNIIGNYDHLGSGYGYYNNVNDSSGEYAPSGTAGLFIRFKLSVDSSSTTFFLPTIVGESKLWCRKKGGVCVKL